MLVWELKQALDMLDDDADMLEVVVAGEGGFAGDTGAYIENFEGEHIRFQGIFTGRALVIS